MRKINPARLIPLFVCAASFASFSYLALVDVEVSGADTTPRLSESPACPVCDDCPTTVCPEVTPEATIYVTVMPPEVYVTPCVPTVTPPPLDCKDAFSFTLDGHRFVDNNHGTQTLTLNPGTVTNPIPGCLQQTINRITTMAASRSNWGGQGLWRTTYNDDRAAELIFGRARHGGWTYVDPALGSVDATLASIAEPFSQYDCLGIADARSTHQAGSCVSALFYMKEINGQCQALTDEERTQARRCSQVKAAVVGNWTQSSPISLLWDDTVDIEAEVTLSNFPLEPAAKAWYLWKASSRAPLLVFDPAHEGKITAAAQLFGSWSFGGQRQASAKSEEPLAKPWNNGYQALETLDTNHDGKLANEELAPLALWFDSNRDGSSQPGEVKPVSELGVTAIYTKPDKTEGKNIYATKGYERKAGGRIIKGRSVDWFTVGAASRYELLAKFHAIDNPLIKDEGNAIASAAVGDKDMPVASNASALVRDALSGIWAWHFEDSDKRPNEVGMFTFRETGENRFQGYSYFQSPLQREVGYLNSMITAHLLKGSTTALPDGSVKISFETYNGKGGYVANEATISKDHKTMTGQSTLNRENEEGKLVKMNYSWTATRAYAGKGEPSREGPQPKG